MPVIHPCWVSLTELSRGIPQTPGVYTTTLEKVVQKSKPQSYGFLLDLRELELPLLPAQAKRVLSPPPTLLLAPAMVMMFIDYKID